MSVLSRETIVGIAAESVPGVYEIPAFTVVHDKASYHQNITQLRDTALRGSDSQLQDVLQGPAWATWTIPSACYPDLAGFWLRGLIGPDTCTPGVTTTVASAAAAGATAVTLNAQPAAGAVLMLGAWGASLEYAQCGTPAGFGPYTVPLESALLYAHPSGDSAQSQATHVFAQDPEGPTFSWPRWSLTTDDGTGPLGWPGNVVSSLSLSIPADGPASMKAQATGFMPASVETFAYDATAAQPSYGWQWHVTTGGGPSTRGIAAVLTLHRETGVFPTVAGYQQPIGIWPGPLMADAGYTAIFEDQPDMNLYLEALVDPVVFTLAQPVLSGGSSISLTMPGGGWLDGEPIAEDTYLHAAYKISGIAQPAGGAAFTATLVNFYQEAFG